MCFTDPTILSLPSGIRYIGLLFFITGIVLFIFSHVNLKGFEDKGHLVRKGIYSRIRNPMYLGFVLWIIGFPLFLQKGLTLLSSIIWITHIMIWKALEEKELEKKYPDFNQYKKTTWF
jgi:protein-S-isoprenylcysteine O-methyltransferase Ste14